MRRSRRPIAARSAKRIAEDDQRRDVRDATFARDGHRCVARLFVPGVPCNELALECDEMQGRGRVPGSHLDLTATQTLCSTCHRLKTDKPRVAGLLGLYGPDEQARRYDDEGPVGLALALQEWARSKSVLTGRPVSGGDLRAVIGLAERRGVPLAGAG